MQDSPFLRNFLKISTYRRPTDDLMRFPPPDNLQNTSRHLLKEIEKISVLLYKILEVWSLLRMLKMANFRSSMDHQTHKGFDISKNF